MSNLTPPNELLPLPPDGKAPLVVTETQPEDTAPDRGLVLTLKDKGIAVHTSSAEIDSRVTHVYMMLRQGFPRPDVHEYGKRQWGVSKHTIDKYMKKARDIIKDENAQVREEAFSEIQTKFTDIYRKVYVAAAGKGMGPFDEKTGKRTDAPDPYLYRMCIDVLKEKGKLHGLYDPVPEGPDGGTPGGTTQVQVTNNVLLALDGGERDMLRQAMSDWFEVMGESERGTDPVRPPAP